MPNALLRDLDGALLDQYRAAAQASGRSLNAELKDGLLRGQPKARRTKAELIALSRELCARSGPMSDSTPYIRWMRDTDDGRNLGGSGHGADRS